MHARSEPTEILFSLLCDEEPAALEPVSPAEVPVLAGEGSRRYESWRVSGSGGVVTREFRATDACSEWVLRLENRGDADSPLLSEIQPLDAVLRSEDGGCFVFDGYAENDTGRVGFLLHYARGGKAGPEDYRPETVRLGKGAGGRTTFALGGGGGRSSNDVLPFFNLQTGPESGVIVAVGWSGQWRARFDVRPDGGLRLRAGMETARLRLHPGESVRTPGIAWFPWRGDRREAQNAWRRWLRRHVLPDLDGREPPPFSWGNTWFTFDCGYGVDEENQAESLAGAGRLGLEYMVIDAGWYDCPHPYWWDGVGSWTPREEAFPNGIRPLVEAAERSGVKLGLWFEPERAALTSRLAREHPEWLLGEFAPTATQAATVEAPHVSCLVNFGLREVQDWAVELIGRYAEAGVAWFRHDFNLDPLAIWRHADPPERQGITEIRYVEGLYRVYDELRRRYPALVIEGCASGGRRIDLEVLRRNHGYWATDMMCGTPEPIQAHLRGWSDWLLPNWHNTVLQMKNAPREDTPANRYAFFSFLGGAPCYAFDLRDGAVDAALGRRWIELFEDLRRLTQADYYPLAEWSLSEEAWHAFQYHDPREDAGFVAAFRRPRSYAVEVGFALRGLSPERTYRMTEAFTDQTVERTGADASPFPIRIEDRPGVAIFRYHPA